MRKQKVENSQVKWGPDFTGRGKTEINFRFQHFIVSAFYLCVFVA